MTTRPRVAAPLVHLALPKGAQHRRRGRVVSPGGHQVAVVHPAPRAPSVRRARADAARRIAAAMPQTTGSRCQAPHGALVKGPGGA